MMKMGRESWPYRLWVYWARLWGILGFAAITAFFIIYPQKNGVVWTTENFQLLTPTITQGGPLRFLVDVIPTRACPGNVVTTISSRPGQGSPAVVEHRRPIIHPGIRKNHLMMEVDLSDAVTPGIWDVVVMANSRCPTYTQSDRIAGPFEITVVPK